MQDNRHEWRDVGQWLRHWLVDYVTAAGQQPGALRIVLLEGQGEIELLGTRADDTATPTLNLSATYVTPSHFRACSLFTDVPIPGTRLAIEPDRTTVLAASRLAVAAYWQAEGPVLTLKLDHDSEDVVSATEEYLAAFSRRVSADQGRALALLARKMFPPVP
jgi:hypothetical protein